MPAALPAATPAAVDQTTASSSSIRQLDRDEVNMLVKRGEEFLMTGDFAAARLMLQRAAEAGDPHASLDLGATYDPIEVETPRRTRYRRERCDSADLVREGGTVWLRRSAPAT